MTTIAIFLFDCDDRLEQSMLRSAKIVCYQYDLVLMDTSLNLSIDSLPTQYMIDSLSLKYKKKRKKHTT